MEYQHLTFCTTWIKRFAWICSQKLRKLMKESRELLCVGNKWSILVLYGWDNKIDPPRKKETLIIKGLMDFIRSLEKANKSWSLYTTKKVSLFFQSIDSFLWYKGPFLSAHVLFSVWEFYACPHPPTTCCKKCQVAKKSLWLFLTRRTMVVWINRLDGKAAAGGPIV